MMNRFICQQVRNKDGTIVKSHLHILDVDSPTLEPMFAGHTRVMRTLCEQLNMRAGIFELLPW